MATNINLTTFENCAIIYLNDGSTLVVDPHKEYFLQLANMGFCTISEAADPDSQEHPPEKIAEAWKAFWEVLGDQIEGPEVNPL